MKNGLDYFSLDVVLDSKMELMEAEYGLKGFAIIVKLYQQIYGGEGYWLSVDNEMILLFAKKISADCNLVSVIIDSAIRRGLFDSKIYEKYRVLTSVGIQKRYFEAVKRRVDVDVKAEYLLLPAIKKNENVNISKENVNISKENVNINKQSKVKESKVKKSKVKNIQEGPSVFDVLNIDLKNALKNFEVMRNKIKSPLTENARELLLKKLSKLTTNRAEQVLILEQSIFYGWKSVYPLKNEENQNEKIIKDNFNNLMEDILDG